MPDNKLILAGILAFATGMYFFLSGAHSRLPVGPSLSDLINMTGRELEAVRDMSDSFGLVGYSDLIVIPDIHGDSENFIRCIWIALSEVNKLSIGIEDLEGLILLAAVRGEYPEVPLLPSNHRSAMIQMGDIVDRGPDSVLCLRILWVIEKVVGWRVVSLIGNHEVMSSTGIPPEYIHKRDLSEFRSLRKRYEQFSPGRPLWDKLMEKSLIGAKFFSDPSPLKNTLFVHAGIDPVFLYERHHPSILEINKNSLTALSNESEKVLLNEWLSNEKSPVWTRIFGDRAYDEDEESILCEEILPPILKHMGVSRIVVGHTPQRDHLMKSRCGSRIILTDCAVSRWLYMDLGQPGILVLSNGEGDDWAKIQAIHFDVASKNLIKSNLLDHVSNFTD